MPIRNPILSPISLDSASFGQTVLKFSSTHPGSHCCDFERQLFSKLSCSEQKSFLNRHIIHLLTNG